MKALARHTFWVFGLTMMVASMVLVGCGSNDGGGAPSVIAPIGPGVAACPAGQVMTQYNCLYTASCQNIYPGYGWLPGENRCVPPLPGATAPTSGTFLARDLQIINEANFGLFLESFGLCRTYWSLGNIDCESYSHAGYLSLQTSGASGGTLPSLANLTLGAGAGYPGGRNTDWTTGGQILRPSFSANLSPANNNNGFTGRGPYGFRFVVNNGLPGNSYQMNVDLEFNGAVFARGTLIAQ